MLVSRWCIRVQKLHGVKVKAIDQAAVGIVDSRLILITNASNKLVTQVTSRDMVKSKAWSFPLEFWLRRPNQNTTTSQH